jgi:hypothetical protein
VLANLYEGLDDPFECVHIVVPDNECISGTIQNLYLKRFLMEWIVVWHVA